MQQESILHHYFWQIAIAGGLCGVVALALIAVAVVALLFAGRRQRDS